MRLPPRREIGIRTVFNILGPLTNPARAEYQVIGVPNEKLAEKIAHVLYRLGTKHSLVVCGMNGMDEISISGKSLLWEVNEYGVSPPYEISPEDFGFRTADLSQIRGGTPEENAKMLRNVLEGEAGAKRDVVIMNSAAVLVAGNLATDLKEGVQIAQEAIDSGKALIKLDDLIKVSQSLR